MRFFDNNCLVSFRGGVFAALCFVTFFYAGLHAQEWSYVSTVNQNKVIWIDSNPSSFGINSQAYPALFCDDKDAFICIKSDPLTLHIPRQIPVLVNTWRVGEYEYMITEADKSLLGEKVHFIIDRMDSASNDTFRFLYSTKRGVLGIGMVDLDNQKQGMFLLNRECGFGASSECEDSYLMYLSHF